MQAAKQYKPMTIKRFRKFELDFAIEDLEERGFVLIKRGEINRIGKDWNYRDNGFVKRKFTGYTDQMTYWAVLEKKIE